MIPSVALGLALQGIASETSSIQEFDFSVSQINTEAGDYFTQDEPTQLSSILFEIAKNNSDWRVFINKNDCSLIFGGNEDSYHLSVRFDPFLKKTTIFIENINFWAVEDYKQYNLFVNFEYNSERVNFKGQFIGKKLPFGGAQLSVTREGFAILEDISRSRNVGFWAPTGELIRSYDLKFGKTGVNSLLRCAKARSK